MEGVTAAVQFDLREKSVRELNAYLHGDDVAQQVEVTHSDGYHNIAVGIDAPINVTIKGHCGYYVAGMNKQAHVHVQGNVGPGVGENMMSGKVHVTGSASAYAGATSHGGLLVIQGDTSSRCGISLKGADIVVGGSVGHVTGFMAQAGRIVICGDAGHGLGDSLYEAVIYLRGDYESLGADAQEQSMTEADHAALAELLSKAGLEHDTAEFKRIASAKTLYHWNADKPSKYSIN